MKSNFRGKLFESDLLVFLFARYLAKIPVRLLEGGTSCRSNN